MAIFDTGRNIFNVNTFRRIIPKHNYSCFLRSSIKHQKVYITHYDKLKTDDTQASLKLGEILSCRKEC